MDSFLLIVNFICSLLLSLAFSVFMIFIFGRNNSKLYKFPSWKINIVKVGFALCTAGALLNALTISNPPPSEVLLNFGLTVVMVWAAIFHYFEYVVPIKKQVSSIDHSITNNKKAKSKVNKKLSTK
jgi:hypothetical protein